MRCRDEVGDEVPPVRALEADYHRDTVTGRGEAQQRF